MYSCDPGASAVDTRKIQRARVYARTSDRDLKSRGDTANAGQWHLSEVKKVPYFNPSTSID